jgi:type VII secretion protein EccB
MQRVVAALVTHDPDPSRSPFRRVGSTALISLLIAAVALGGTAVYALFTGRGAQAADEEAVVYIEKETGAQFIFTKADGRLHPVLNYASGLLIIASANAKSDQVSRKTLATVPRGATMGIPDAPNALPRPSDLLTGAWAVCSQSPDGAPQSLLAVGEKITGGTSAAPVAGPPPGALLVQDPTGKTFLMYGSRRFLIPNSRSVLAAFVWSERQPVKVAAGWLNAVPAGPDLAPIPIPERGKASGVPGVANGRVLQSRDEPDGPSQWAVALPGGAAVISEMQAKLLLNESSTGQVIKIKNSQFGDLKRSSDQAIVDRALAGLPTTVPPLLTVSQRLCLTVSPVDGRTDLLIDPDAPDPGNPVPASAAGTTKIDRIRVHPGRGVLVESVASPTAPVGSGTISIVTDAGTRYPIADADTVANLGYGGIKPRRLPAELVALLPEGPALDPVQARKPQPGTA